MVARVDFRIEDIERLITDKGYWFIWEKALMCPCNNASASNYPLQDCPYCDGKGFYYVEPTTIQGIKTAVDSSASMQNQAGIIYDGSCFITTLPAYKPSFLDRFTDINSVAVHSEKLAAGQKTRYPVMKVVSTAAYQEIPVTNETVIAAYNGETTGTLDYGPVKGASTTLYYDGTAKVDMTDFTVNLTSKVATFVTFPRYTTRVSADYTYQKMTTYTSSDVGVGVVNYPLTTVISAWNDQKYFDISTFKNIVPGSEKVYYASTEMLKDTDYVINYSHARVYFNLPPQYGVAVSFSCSYYTGALTWAITEPAVYTVRYEHHPRYVVVSIPNTHRDTFQGRVSSELFKEMPIRSRCIMDHLANYKALLSS